MKPENIKRLLTVRERFEDTLDGDLVGESYRTYVHAEQEDLQTILEVIADEVGLTVGNPPSDEQYDAVYDAIRDDDLSDLWDIIDGWTPGSRSSSVLDALPEA